jgi:hypothetical protein
MGLLISMVIDCFLPDNPGVCCVVLGNIKDAMQCCTEYVTPSVSLDNVF